METATHKEIELGKAFTIFLLAASIIAAAGFSIGEFFFWGGNGAANPVDKDIAYLEELAHQTPSDKTLVELGWRYYRKGDFQKATEVLSEAVRLNKLNPAAHFNLGLTYQEIKLLEKAEAEFIKTLEIDPESKFAYFALGKLYFLQERWEEAANQLEIACQKDPIAVENYYWLGQAYEKQGLKQEAKAAYQRVLDRIPNHSEAREAYYRLK